MVKESERVVEANHHQPVWADPVCSYKASVVVTLLSAGRAGGRGASHPACELPWEHRPRAYHCDGL